MYNFWTSETKQIRGYLLSEPSIDLGGDANIPNNPFLSLKTGDNNNDDI